MCSIGTARVRSPVSCTVCILLSQQLCTAPAVTVIQCRRFGAQYGCGHVAHMPFPPLLPPIKPKTEIIISERVALPNNSASANKTKRLYTAMEKSRIRPGPGYLTMSASDLLSIISSSHIQHWHKQLTFPFPFLGKGAHDPHDPGQKCQT